MTEMCKTREPYRCACCGEEMLFFVSDTNRLIDYKKLFLQYGINSTQFKTHLYRRYIRYLKCLCCNRYFIIDWTTGYPTQLLDKEKLDKFMCKG